MRRARGAVRESEWTMDEGRWTTVQLLKVMRGTFNVERDGSGVLRGAWNVERDAAARR